MQRALGELPKQASRDPWQIHQNYLKDLITLKYSRVDDGTMLFSRARPLAAPKPQRPPLRASA